MRFDDILTEIGQFGRYQRRLYAIVFVVAMPVAWHQMAQVFLAGYSDHWCAVAEWSDEDCNTWGLKEEDCIEAKRNASSPVNGTEDEKCYKYAIVDDLAFDPGLDPNTYNDTTLIKCNDGWIYDKSQYESSIIQEFNLVCDDANLDSLSQSLFFVGVLIGSVLFGAISDIIGRRYTLFIALFLQASFGVGVAFAPSYWVYTSLRIVLASANMGVFLLAFVIGTEFVGTNWRTVAAMGIQIAFSFGYMIMTIFAYYIRVWWILQLVLSAPIFLFLFFYPFLPESVRWLLCKGRSDEASLIIHKAAKVNKASLPDPLFTEEEIKEQEASQSGPQPNALDLFKTPNLRIRTCNCMFNWFVNTLVYYGLSLSTSDLGVGDYLAFFISGAVELPAYVTAIFAIEYFGRKWSTFGYMVFGGVACLITIVTPLGAWRTTVAMLGKFGISASFGIIYIYSAELFPTPVRSVGVGLCSMSARVAGILAPIVLLLDQYWEHLSKTIFGITAIIAGCLILFLPETLGASLPQTLEEGEMFGTKQKVKNEYELEVVEDPRQAIAGTKYSSKTDDADEFNGQVNKGYDSDDDKANVESNDDGGHVNKFYDGDDDVAEVKTNDDRQTNEANM